MTSGAVTCSGGGPWGRHGEAPPWLGEEQNKNNVATLFLFSILKAIIGLFKLLEKTAIIIISDWAKAG